MMEVQAGPSSPHHLHHQFQSASGTGAPTFIPSGTGAEAFHPLSQANPSTYPGFAPATMTPQMFANTTLDGGNIMRKSRKRKADSQDNERLSKRLSLLNLGMHACTYFRSSTINGPGTTNTCPTEHNGNKLYVPVESPQLRPTTTTTANSLNHQIPEAEGQIEVEDDGEDMQLDDTRHKVYIYNLDDELSSSDGESSADEGGRLMFLPDIQKHLMQNRIPPSVLANSEGELAGMQMVLYREPTSLSVPEEQDSVRRAIIEARHRLREKQGGEQRKGSGSESGGSTSSDLSLSSSTEPSSIDEMLDDTPPPPPPPQPALSNGYAANLDENNDDPDAMDMD